MLNFLSIFDVLLKPVVELSSVVLLDFSAAFDPIDHLLLLGKLKQYGFNLTAVKLMENYLSNMSQTPFFFF